MKAPTKGQVSAALRYYAQSTPQRDDGLVRVIDITGRDLAPCRHGMARKLIKSGQAEIASRQPFVIRLKRSMPTEGRR